MEKRETNERRDDIAEQRKQIFVVENSYKQLATNLLTVEPPASYERVGEVDTVGNRPPSSLFFSRYRRKSDPPNRKDGAGVRTEEPRPSGIPVPVRKLGYNNQQTSRPSTSKSEIMVSALPAVDINRNVTPLQTDKILVCQHQPEIIPNGHVAKVVTFIDPIQSKASASTEEIAPSPSPTEASGSSSRASKGVMTPSSVLSLRRDRVPSGYSNLDRTLEFGDANLLMERRRAIYALGAEKETLWQKCVECECLEWNLNTAAILITVAVLTAVVVLVIYVILQMVSKKN